MSQEEVLSEILNRLTRIEEKLDLHNNPTRYVSLTEAAIAMRDARASGDKARIKAAAKLVGRGRRKR